MLAVIALALGTTILIKMNRERYAWVTLTPMLFLLVVTMTAGWQKITRADAAGFLPTIAKLRAQLPGAAPADAVSLQSQVFNNRVDIVVTATFMALVLIIVAANALLWWRLLTGRAERRLCEDPAVPHPELEIVEG